MKRSKSIRSTMAAEYDNAKDKGITTKLLKTIIKERKLERDIAALKDDLENDELSELEMLTEKLGEFANTPLGRSALSRADGAQAAAE